MVMRVGVLGPVVAWQGERTVPVGGARERYVLAALVLNTDRLTPADRLIDELWAVPPPTARAQLHNLVSRLRARLGGGVIVTRPTGYELSSASAAVDLLEFRELVARGRLAMDAGDLAPAETALTGALALWRGPALADVTAERATPVRLALHEERLAARETRLACRLALGRYDEVLAEVEPLVAEHPYREGLAETAMLALAAVGRQADALQLYRQVYRRLQDDLGVSPGASLAGLEQRILRGAVPAVGRATPAVVPRQLPPQTPALTGRGTLVAEVAAALTAGDSNVVTLVGPGGVGKTALAVTAARQVSGAFPDGQLFAVLRGAQRDPADPHDLAGRFLRDLGVEGPAVPADPDERISLYRSTLAARRVLLVLDDAATEAQVRPLLPGSPSSATLVTSRHQLGALLAPARWTVPALDPAESVELMASIAGGQRVSAEPEAAREVAALCGNLPLATCVAAARLTVHPQWTVVELRDRLAGERGRLDELAIGDLDVRASIATSYRLLAPAARLLLRRLAVAATTDWPAWFAAVLLDADGTSAGRLLDVLADVHLIEPLGPDAVGQQRYRLHDLIAAFAAERAAAEEQPAELNAALVRVLSGWSGLAGVADERAGHGMQGAAGLPAWPVPHDADGPARTTPREWFDVEWPGLVMAVQQACDLGAAEIAAELALRLSGFLAMRTYDAERDRVLRAAVAAARANGADRHLVRLLLSLFGVAAQRSAFTELPALAAEALALARRVGDRLAEVGALGNAGWAAQSMGRLAEAAHWFGEAVAVCDESIPPQLARWMALSLARTRHEAGRSAEAVPVVERLLATRDPDETPRSAALLLTLGADALLGAGRPDDARQALAEAARMIGGLGDELGDATIELALARVDLYRRDWAAAHERLARTLPILEKLGVQTDLAAALGTLGELELSRGRPAQAADALRRSLQLWTRLDAPLEMARTRARLAYCEPDRAAAHRRESRRILRDLGLTDEALRLPASLAPAGTAPGR
jgi:DNA-binding SARP family transcriptional activator/predicted ATPase